MRYKLGQLIEQYDEINDKGEFQDLESLQGINSLKYFQECKSNKNDIDLYRYRICRKGMFAYNRATSRNGEKISIAYREGDDCLISPSYYCFKIVREDLLLADYLMIWLKRPVFDKYARFHSWGSATEFFTFEDFCDTEIVLPSIETQRKIVHDYKVIIDRIELLKKINENLEKQAYIIYDSEVKDSTIYCKIEDIGTFVRGKNITSEEMVAGEYNVISAGINPSGCHNEYNVKGPSITISGSGVNAGFFSIHSENIWAADCSYCNNTNYLFFLFCSLQRVKDKIEILKDGHSAQPHVYPKDVNIIEIPSLEASHLNKIESILQKIYTAIFANCNEIRKLELLETSIVSKLSRNKEVA